MNPILDPRRSETPLKLMFVGVRPRCLRASVLDHQLVLDNSEIGKVSKTRKIETRGGFNGNKI